MAERLDDWVRAHRVCWEIAPMHGRLAEDPESAFELTLLARCAASRGIDPGRPECHAVHERLAEIAGRVLTSAAPHHLEPYDESVHLRPESAFAPEIELLAEVFPRASEAKRVRASIVDLLEELGVQSHAWADGVLRQAGRVRHDSRGGIAAGAGEP